MKHFEKLAVVPFLVVIALTACASSSESSGSESLGAANSLQSSGTAVGSGDFSDVVGKEWRLAELRLVSRRIEINRDKLEAEGFGEIFTLRFGDSLVSGTGAPNTYRGPYTLTGNQAVSIGMLASTQMAAFREPEELKEHDFYGYLHDVYRWNLANGNLELYTRGTGGTEAVLVFASVR